MQGCIRYGPWNQYRRKLYGLKQKMTVAGAAAVKKEAVYFVSMVRMGIRNQAPGGESWEDPLHPWTIKNKGSSKALIDSGQMVAAITHKTIAPMSCFVGLLRTTVHVSKDGNTVGMADLGNIHEEGVWISVTPKMKAYLHYHGLHLAPDTVWIHIPGRPFIRPVAEKEMPGIQQRIALAMVAPLL